MPKKKAKNPADYYNPTEEDWDAFLYCNRNNIRISIHPMEKGMYPAQFKVSVALGPYQKFEKPALSPKVYSIEQIIEQKFKACKYYYEKYKRGI